jgi:pimeloyl-ACP methyl ester carboxylesterase
MQLIPTLVGRTLRSASVVSPRLAGRLAFGLFRYPGPRARVRTSERHSHGQARNEVLQVAGERVVVYRWGDGARPVLMLHGWGSRGSRYAPFVPALLAEGLSPLTFDAPGHGGSSGRSTHLLSYAAIVNRIHERYGPFHAVIGHSFGALVAFRALRTGSTASRLVTIGSPAEFGYLPDAFAAGLGLGLRPRADLRRRTERFFAPEADIWHRFSATSQPADLPMPMLVVHDERDTVVDPAQAQRIVAAYGPRARLLATRGLGHHRILSAPPVVRQVTEFLAGGPATQWEAATGLSPPRLCLPARDLSARRS